MSKYTYLTDKELLKILPKAPKNSYSVFDNTILITPDVQGGKFKFQNILKFKELLDNESFTLFITNKYSYPNDFKLVAKDIKTNYEFIIENLLNYEDFILFKLDMIKCLPELKENINKAAHKFIIEDKAEFNHLTEEYISSLIEIFEIKKKLNTFK